MKCIRMDKLIGKPRTIVRPNGTNSILYTFRRLNSSINRKVSAFGMATNHQKPFGKLIRDILKI